MKPNTLIQKLLAAAALLAAMSPAVFAESAGTRGGGDAVVLDGHPALRDWVDNTVCEWKHSETITSGITALPGLLASIRDVDPVFELAIEEKMKELDFCVVDANLKPIPTEDRDAVTPYSIGSNKIQAAVRIGHSVYISRSVFEKMDSLNQAGLVVHETLHSFLPMDTPMRNGRLRSTSALILRNYRSRIGYAEFFYNLHQNSISISYATLSPSHAGNLGEDDLAAAGEAGFMVFLHPELDPNYGCSISQDANNDDMAVDVALSFKDGGWRNPLLLKAFSAGELASRVTRSLFKTGCPKNLKLLQTALPAGFNNAMTAAEVGSPVGNRLKCEGGVGPWLKKAVSETFAKISSDEIVPTFTKALEYYNDTDDNDSTDIDIFMDYLLSAPNFDFAKSGTEILTIAVGAGSPSALGSLLHDGRFSCDSKITDADGRTRPLRDVVRNTRELKRIYKNYCKTPFWY